MSDKEAVLEVIQKLPENTSMESIRDEIETLASVRRGQSDIATGRHTEHGDVKKLVRLWAGK